MRLFLLTALTMVAFAANSILNRFAVDSDAVDPGSFAIVRVLAGAVTLAGLVLLRRGQMEFLSARRLAGGGSLSLYLIGFSLAYLTLDAGAGALILFGVVQMTMFAVTSLTGAPPSGRQLIGAGVAFAGLAWVLWPSEGALVDPTGAALMTAAGIGWGIYTLVGRLEKDALSGTAANFVVALPVTVGGILVITSDRYLSTEGVALAVISGAVTSGLGYALWYRVLPHLATAVAGTVQLSVPIIALLSGSLLLGEALSMDLALGALLVLGGIALASLKPNS
ncbi:EamA-like transporter family protein [Falsiruegeria litorea R37]|uniref:EamA-like transporter family protein n=1 Tax=Falsiruegeria litorea R37 TaxID=1200284 RepID=A0A1Y5RYG6_9RHOB|nr:DMT family transporter [Falsiruegeria litorea]SLN28273.1 EamA-like transporter family protein [Falsiruegeria litorea R37]